MQVSFETHTLGAPLYIYEQNHDHQYSSCFQAVKPVFISDFPIDLAIVASLLGRLMGSRWKVENHWRKRWRQRLATQSTNLNLS